MSKRENVMNNTRNEQNPLGDMLLVIYEDYVHYHAHARKNFSYAKMTFADIIWKQSKKVWDGFVSVEALEHVKAGLIKKPVYEHFIPISIGVEKILLTDQPMALDDFTLVISQICRVRKVSREENYKLKKFYANLTLEEAIEQHEQIYAACGIVKSDCP